MKTHAYWRRFWANLGVPLAAPRISAPVRPYRRARPRPPRVQTVAPPAPVVPVVPTASNQVTLEVVDWSGGELVPPQPAWLAPIEVKLERRTRELETEPDETVQGNAYDRLGPPDQGGRSFTVSRKQMQKEARAARRRREADGPMFGPEEPQVARPRTRGDCLCGPRPCPWVGCKWNLYLDVDEQLGSIKYNFPNLEVDQVPNNCALDVADRGGITLEQLGDLINVTRERVRQVEEQALERLMQNAKDL